jgi:hypothetical protein
VEDRIIWEVVTIHFPELRKAIVEMKARASDGSDQSV